MAATYTLNNTLQWVLPWVNYYPLALVSTQQPFLGMCERVAQVLLAPPFKPNFNRNSIKFVTTAGVQTYMYAGSWAASTAYSVGTTVIDGNGNGQTVTVAGTSGSSTPSWSTGTFSTTTDNSVTWQNAGALGSIPQITDYAYIEKAAVQDVNNGNVWKELGVSLNLPRDSQTGCPKYVAAQTDDNVGDIAIRLTPTPAAAYPVDVQYQKLHQPFTTLANLWSPIPDRLFYTYGFGVLSLAYLYKGDSRAPWASQQFVTGVLAYYGGLSESEKNQFLQSWQGTLTDSLNTQKAQQGVAARGV